MAITINSPILGPSMPESLDEALAYTRRYGNLDTFAEAYIRALYSRCLIIGLRFELAFAQWCDETGIGTQPVWLTYRNAGSIGALDDGTYVGISYTTPDESALGQLIHLWLYVVGINLPPSLAPYKHLDPRWDVAISKGKAGSAKTLKGLAASWATNPDYAIQIAKHANNCFGVLPERGIDVPEQTIIFGKVPPPVYVDDYIPSFDGQAAGYYGKRFLYGVVWHRMVGTLIGTRHHFRAPNTGLTDFGVGVAGVDGADLDGVIYRWNDPLGMRSGFANGRIIAPWGDGLAFLNEFAPIYGYDIANRGQVSIEISGQYGTPLTAKSRAAIVAITAYYADQARIPWDVFPVWPGHGYSFVRYHQEMTGPVEKECPGWVVIGETATLIDMVKARLKQYQVGQAVPKPRIYASPIIPAWLKEDVQAGRMRDHSINGIKVYGLEREYTALRETPRKQGASRTSSAIVGPPIKAGERFYASHALENEFVLTPAGTRVDARDLTPQVIISPRSA